MDHQTKELLDAWDAALSQVQHGGRVTELIRAGGALAEALEDAVNALEDKINEINPQWAYEWKVRYGNNG